MNLRRLFLAVFVLAAGIAAGLAVASSPATASRPSQAQSCPPGYVDAIIDGQEKCLRAGEFCSPADESQYEHYGFTCVDGHLKDYQGSTTTTQTTTTAPTTTAPTTTTGATTTTATTTTAPATTTAVTTTAPTTSTTLTSPPPPTTGPRPPTGSAGKTGPIGVGRTVRLRARAKTSGCTLGLLPDRRCSPGAYYTGLTKAVLCSSSFHTSSVRNVPDSEKHAVEVEYGMTPKSYGRTLEVDHIVSLELGGSNDIANLFPERAPGCRVKDKLENKLHVLVCSGAMTLHAAQVGIAANWQVLYKNVYGIAPGV